MISLIHHLRHSAFICGSIQTDLGLHARQTRDDRRREIMSSARADCLRSCGRRGRAKRAAMRGGLRNQKRFVALLWRRFELRLRAQMQRFWCVCFSRKQQQNGFVRMRVWCERGLSGQRHRPQRQKRRDQKQRSVAASQAGEGGQKLEHRNGKLLRILTAPRLDELKSARFCGFHLYALNS